MVRSVSTEACKRVPEEDISGLVFGEARTEIIHIYILLTWQPVLDVEQNGHGSV